VLLYIDPGTGSMLFTILIGLLSVVFYAGRSAFMKLRFRVSGGGVQIENNHKKIPYVIFSDSKRYWIVFKPICDEFERRQQELLYLTASADDPALSEEYKYVTCQFAGEGNKAFARLNMLNAGIVLSTTPSLDVYQWKRSRDVLWYVHIPHAPSDLTVYKMFGIDYYDAILLSGDYQAEQIRQLEEIRGLPEKELKMVGLTYLDEMKERLSKLPVPAQHPVTVLLAPSWGANSILNRYGGEMIEALLGTGYHLIIRPHPQSFSSEKDMLDRLMKAFPAGDHLEWDRNTDNFETLYRSDIMISDFSGVIFDFALVFDKPIIYADTSFDKSQYDACWLDEDLWTFRVLPQIGQQLTRENLIHIKELIDDSLTKKEYQIGRDRARQETWQFPGEAAVRTVDYLTWKYKELLGSSITDIEAGRSLNADE